jgi:hypothetical protein
LNGVKVIKGKERGIKGSTTIEATIVLPMLLIVVFSMAYIIRIFFIYNIMQDALSEVGRRYGNMSYFYHVTGLKDYSDALNTAADEAETTLTGQKDTLVNAFDSFNGIISGSSGQAVSTDSIMAVLDKADDLSQASSDANDLVRSIIADPKAELRMIITIFARKLNYNVTNKLVSLMAKGSLGKELGKRLNTDDPASVLGIEGGLAGIDFEQTSIFGDSESLEFVVSYTVKAPIVFMFTPDIKLSNRVKIIAWTGGRGESVLKEEKKEDEKDEKNASVWTKMDNDKKYWDRGLEIEKLETDKIVSSAGRGDLVYVTPRKYPVIDAYIYNESKETVEYYDIFTLNPFMKTYSEKPSAIKSEIKKHAKRLLEFDTPDLLKEKNIKYVKRIVIMIIPENSGNYAVEQYNKAKEELEQYEIDIRLEKAYGTYEKAEEEEALEKAS